MQHNKQYLREVLLSSFHLNDSSLGFSPQTQILHDYKVRLLKTKGHIQLQALAHKQTSLFPVVLTHFIFSKQSDEMPKLTEELAGPLRQMQVGTPHSNIRMNILSFSKCLA